MTLLGPLPLLPTSPVLSPHPGPFSPRSSLFLFSLCLSASFLLMKTLTKWEWGGEEDQPASDPHRLVTSLHHGHSTATRLSSSLALSLSIKGSES